MMRLAWAAVPLLALTLRCSPDQHAHPVPRPPQPKGPVLASQDRDFIERATEGNNAEISIGGLAPERAFRPAVTEFGRLMVADHRAANAQLGAIARQRSIALPGGIGEHQSSYDRLIGRRNELFDDEFLRVMIADHQDAVLLYQGEASTGVDPLLRAYAANLLPKIQAHLEHAKSLNSISP